MPRALVIKQIEGKPGKVYYPLALDTVPTPTLGPNELTIQIRTCALNHRDHFLRQHLYPGIAFSVPLLADGCGIVSATGPGAATSWLGQRVILTPGRGWASSIEGPDSAAGGGGGGGGSGGGGGGYAILGGTKQLPIGTAQDELCVPDGEVERAPEHLTDAEAAALPLTGLTAWRALVVKSGNAVPGRNILVTGVGGGVALNVVQFGVARGCAVFVTSGSEEKIARARELGAVGGVSYKKADWDRDLARLLPRDRPWLDAVVDGAGGDICARTVKLLKFGGVVVTYGMTLGPKIDWSMGAVMKNIELRGSTMGSRKEFKEMVEFVREHKIRPVVSKVVRGLDNMPGIESLFADMKNGAQFGKLVIEVSEESSSSKL